MVHGFIMPKHLVESLKRICGAKTQGNLFFHLSLHIILLYS